MIEKLKFVIFCKWFVSTNRKCNKLKNNRVFSVIAVIPLRAKCLGQKCRKTTRKAIKKVHPKNGVMAWCRHNK